MLKDLPAKRAFVALELHSGIMERPSIDALYFHLMSLFEAFSNVFKPFVSFLAHVVDLSRVECVQSDALMRSFPATCPPCCLDNL